MKTITTVLILFLVITPSTKAQQISGQLTGMPHTSIYLKGFTNFDTYIIDSTQTDANANFKIGFSKQNYGMAIVELQNNNSFLIVLDDEDIQLKVNNIYENEPILVLKGEQNIAYMQYAENQPKREQALSAWSYLQKKYTTDTYFESETKVIETIKNEISKLNQQEIDFLENLDSTSFLRWYIPTRKLLSSVAQVAQYQPEKISVTLTALRQLDYADARLYKSGLLKEAIENPIWFIENSSGSLEQVFADLNTSIDLILEQLKEDNEKFNLVASYLFEVLEKRSLFTSSEYLSKKLLDGEDCGCLNTDLEKRLHKYGKMATGEIAPDIVFSEFTYFPEGVSAKKLSELQADYLLVVFAAGWCSHCRENIPKIGNLYPELKSNNIEVVMVSLDENPTDFAQFAAPLPFISTTDYLKWDSNAVADYQVYATPSYFLLDKELTIVMKLKSIEHLKAWVSQNIKN